MMKTTYRSGVDAWLIIVMAAVAVALLVSAANVLQSGSQPGRWLTLSAMLFGLALLAWLLLSTRYVINDTHLQVLSGPLRWTISVAEITRITPSGSLLASPALSLDRLRITAVPQTAE